METLKTIKNVRDVVSTLNECREFVINKQKRAEIERLIQELQLLEESLLAKNPMVLSGLGGIATNVAGFASQIQTTPASSIGSAQTLQQFRVFADLQKNTLMSIPAMEQAAAQRGLNPQAAVSSVQKMQENEARIQAEAIASHMMPEIRSMVYGQQVTESALIELVKRKVQGNLTIPANLVDYVTLLIVQQLKLESGAV